MFPEHLHLRTGLRRGLVLHGLGGEGGSGAEADAGGGQPLASRRRACAVSGGTEHRSTGSSFRVCSGTGGRTTSPELSDQAIARAVEHGSKIPTMLSTVHLYPVDGAAQRVGRNDTAYSFREAMFAEVIVGVDPDPANAEPITSWCKDYWEAMHPYSAGGAYVNFMMDEGQERVQASYRDNYPRLAEIKKKVRPRQLLPRESKRPASHIGLSPQPGHGHSSRSRCNSPERQVSRREGAHHHEDNEEWCLLQLLNRQHWRKQLLDQRHSRAQKKNGGHVGKHP
jgi:hypothetical protein